MLCSGGYIKREGRPRDPETLVARLTDRPLRPMFRKGWYRETQLLTWVLSYDGQNLPEPHAITAASAALAVSGQPHTSHLLASQVSTSSMDSVVPYHDHAALQANTVLLPSTLA
jgi:polyribonucleotide nucleotidyltransferase